MTVIKKTPVQTISDSEAEQAASAYASANNQIAQIELLINSNINKIKDKHNPLLLTARAELEHQQEILQAYAIQQLPSWGNKKSMELLHCKIGFKKSPVKVEKDEEHSWESVLNLVRKFFPNLLRTKVELDKEAIKKMKDEKTFNKLADSCHIHLTQDETFYVEPKTA